jgi:hypothetical protein
MKIVGNTLMHSVDNILNSLTLEHTSLQSVRFKLYHSLNGESAGPKVSKQIRKHGYEARPPAEFQFSIQDGVLHF